MSTFSDNLRSTVAERMNRQLDALGWDLERLYDEMYDSGADYCMTDLRWVSNGNSLPSLELVCEMAQAMGVSVDWLVGRS